MAAIGQGLIQGLYTSQFDMAHGAITGTADGLTLHDDRFTLDLGWQHFEYLFLQCGTRPHMMEHFHDLFRWDSAVWAIGTIRQNPNGFDRLIVRCDNADLAIAVLECSGRLDIKQPMAGPNSLSGSPSITSHGYLRLGDVLYQGAVGFEDGYIGASRLEPGRAREYVWIPWTAIAQIRYVPTPPPAGTMPEPPPECTSEDPIQQAMATSDRLWWQLDPQFHFTFAGRHKNQPVNGLIVPSPFLSVDDCARFVAERGHHVAELPDT